MCTCALIATVALNAANNLTVFAHQHMHIFLFGGGGKGTSKIKKINEKEGGLGGFAPPEARAF